MEHQPRRDHRGTPSRSVRRSDMRRVRQGAGLCLYNYRDVTKVFKLRNSMIVFALQAEHLVAGMELTGER